LSTRDLYKSYELRGQVAIAGVAESALGIVPDRTVLSLQMEAAQAALADAGMDKSEIDGLYVSGYGYTERHALLLAEYLGLTPSYVDDTNLGGSGFVAAVERAGAAIRAGLCSTVLITYGSTQRSSATRKLAGRPPEWGYQFEMPYGAMMPITGYALAAQRHMELYGTTLAHLAEVAVAARKWAQLNPKAFKREPLLLEKVMSSPVISSPLRIADCCLVTDGGGAVIVTRADRARQLPKPPVYLLGSGTSLSHEHISQMTQVTETGAIQSGRLAFARAGLKPTAVDVTQIYDSFTITVLLSLEDLGFCPKGTAGEFVANQRTAPGGQFPLNTSGGGLSYTHPGMFGIFLIIEAVRQLRGECGERQVPNAGTALCHGTGVQLSTASTLLLGRDG
jgi:acetyl-CoA acetyltransferase